MAVFKCVMCGGDLDLSALTEGPDAAGIVECPYCGTRQTLPEGPAGKSKAAPPKTPRAGHGVHKTPIPPSQASSPERFPALKNAALWFGVILAGLAVGGIGYHGLRWALGAVSQTVSDSPSGRILWFVIRCGGFLVLYYLFFAIGFLLENRFHLSTALVLLVHFLALLLPFTAIFALNLGWVSFIIYLVVYTVVFLLITPPV